MIKVLSLFSGIGAFEKALKNIGIDYELVGFSEIDKYAIKAYCAIHGVNEELNLGDVAGVADKLSEDEEIDLITHGSPCFVAGTKILTEQGYKNIEDVQIGDRVLTHRNRFEKVLKTGSKIAEIYDIKSQGMLKTNTTEDHPYYVRTMYRRWNGEKKCYERYWELPKWKKVKDLTKNDFIGIPIPQTEENPLNLSEELCWLLGRYVADGYINVYKRKNRPSLARCTAICVGNTKRNEFEKIITSYKYRLDTSYKGCVKYFFGTELTDLILRLNFGKGAINKKIPNIILNLPKNLAKSFLEGYMSGDGCYTNSKYKATSISKELILSLQLLIAKVYKTPSNVAQCERSKTHIIEGRTVNQHDTYQIDFQKEIHRQNHSFVDTDNNIIWYPIKYIKKTKNIDTVYNLEVERDNSYTANNFIVHNCQDYSVSGRQAGGDAGSGTRSSLMWYTVKIVEKVKPKYVIWENVKNVLSKKHRHNFDAYLNSMESLGYTNYYQVLNAKDYGVPQNRERIYVISIRNDIDTVFSFPEAQELKLKLRDLLENEVDEKYYIKSDTKFKKIKAEDDCIKLEQVGELDIKGIDQIKRVYSPEGLSPTITTMERREQATQNSMWSSNAW